jgi:hypothetical protein
VDADALFARRLCFFAIHTSFREGNRLRLGSVDRVVIRNINRVVRRAAKSVKRSLQETEALLTRRAGSKLTMSGEQIYTARETSDFPENQEPKTNTRE